MATIEELCRRLAEDLGAPVALRVSRRARRMALRVDAAERKVELVLPRGLSARTGLSFLEEQRHWVAARLAALPAPVPFAEGALVPLFGVRHRIMRIADQVGPPVAIGDGQIRVRAAPGQLAPLIRRHLIGLARRLLAERATALAARLDRSIARVTVRDTRSRWGSCSSRGSLSFSWRLVLAPEPVLDYVVAHEVAHLVEMNHGPRFWRLVDRLTPHRAAARAWLKRHRAQLLAYG